MTRRASSGTRTGLPGVVLGDGPEPSRTLLVVADRLVQVLAIEVRPVHRREVQLAVRGLPEEEVADALLAAGPDDQVGIRHVGVVQPPRDRLRRELLAPQAPASWSAINRFTASTTSTRPP